MLSLCKLVCARSTSCNAFPRTITASCEISRRNFTSIKDDAVVPPKPRKPATPFLRFLKDSKERIGKEYPDAGYKDIQKIAAEKWRLLPSEVKKSYMDSFDKDKESYFYRRSTYEASLTESQKAIIEEEEAQIAKKREKHRVRKGMIELGRPKKPPNAFGLFFATKTGMKKPGETKTEWVSRIGAEWKNLPDIEKQPFIDQYKSLRLKFEKEIDLWRKEAVQVKSEDPAVIKAQKKIVEVEERHRERILKQESGKNREV